MHFVKKARLLGVIIDTDLRFKPHIDTVCKKVNTKINLLSRRRSLFSKDFNLTLFKLFIIPHFDHCFTIFQHATSKELEKLTGFNILPLKLRFFPTLSKFIFKLIKVSKPALAKQFIKNNTVTRTRCLLPSFHRNQGKFSFRTIATK